MKGSTPKLRLIHLTWPIFVDLFFLFMINVTDAWFLSRVSDNAAAAVGAVLPIIGIGFAIYNTLQQTGKSIASQRLGAKDHEHAATTYGALMVLNLFVGIILVIVFTTGAGTFSAWMGLTGELALMSQSYLTILGMGTWLLALRFAAAAVLASQGKTRWNMYSTALMSVVNVLFNYLLMPTYGVEGIAMASVIAWATSLLFSLAVILGHLKIPIALPHHFISLNRATYPIVKIAVPSFIVPVSWQVTQLVMITMVVGMGEVPLATRIYSFHLLYIVMLYGFAVSAGVQIKVGHLIGAGQYDRAQKTLIHGMELGLAGVTAFMIVLVVFSDQFFGLFTANKSIWAMGSSVLMVAVMGELGRSFNLVVGASLRACGDAHHTAVVGFISMWFIALPLAWYFGVYLAWGVVGIWLGSSIDEVVRGCSNMHRWQTKKWQSKGLYAKH